MGESQGDLRQTLCRTALEATTFTLREATPDSETLIMGECVLEALLTNLA